MSVDYSTNMKLRLVNEIDVIQKLIILISFVQNEVRIILTFTTIVRFYVM